MFKPPMGEFTATFDSRGRLVMKRKFIFDSWRIPYCPVSEERNRLLVTQKIALKKVLDLEREIREHEKQIKSISKDLHDHRGGSAVFKMRYFKLFDWLKLFCWVETKEPDHKYRQYLNDLINDADGKPIRPKRPIRRVPTGNTPDDFKMGRDPMEREGGNITIGLGDGEISFEEAKRIIQPPNQKKGGNQKQHHAD